MEDTNTDSSNIDNATIELLSIVQAQRNIGEINLDNDKMRREKIINEKNQQALALKETILCFKQYKTRIIYEKLIKFCSDAFSSGENGIVISINNTWHVLRVYNWSIFNDDFSDSSISKTFSKIKSVDLEAAKMSVAGNSVEAKKSRITKEISFEEKCNIKGHGITNPHCGVDIYSIIEQVKKDYPYITSVKNEEISDNVTHVRISFIPEKESTGKNKCTIC